MSSEERLHKYALVVTLFFIFAATGIFIYNNPASTTGYAIYDELNDACKSYFGDPICDDSSADCGGAYQPGVSLDECDECQTLKNGKPGFDKCGNEIIDPGAKPSQCNGYFNDGICDDSQADCGTHYQPGTSLDACDECQTLKNGKPGFDKCGDTGGPPKEKPNLYINSLKVESGYFNEPGTIIKQTGIYGKKGSGFLTQIFAFGAIPTSIYYEINEDNSIIKTSKGYNQEVAVFRIYYGISNNGIPTQNDFRIKLQKLKKDSSGWDTLEEGKLVLLEPTHDAYAQISPIKLDNTGVNKLRIVIDTENKIAESNEEDNTYLFEINLKAI